MNFRRLRESRNLTQAQLARMSGVEPATVSQLENGKVRNPTYGTVSKLAAVLGVTTDAVAMAVRETTAA